MEDVFVEESLLSLFPENFCIKNKLLPLECSNNVLFVVSEEDNKDLVEEISSYVKFDDIVFRVCKEGSIVFHIKKLYSKFNFSIDRSQANDSGEYVCDKIIIDAFTKKASDIHFCPAKKSVFVKYRVDGILREVLEFEKEKWASVSVRIKILSDLDISETRIPQDGSFSKEISGKQIDFRVACHPTMHGENIVLRVLGNSKSINLNNLNYSGHIMEDINKFIETPDGLIIFTGPVGSGKTTSLYSILSRLDPKSNNIVTLEDPIESYIPFVRQTDINKSPNMSFASGIKSLLRQDPNVMLIGEIRDSDTAHMVMRAAMTGHKVFTTMHTNNAFGVFDRLVEFGIEKSLIFQYLKGIVSQRLVRKLCCCKVLAKNNIPDCIKYHSKGSSFIFEANGCAKCDYTGFDGRVVVAESLFVDGKRKTGNIMMKNNLSDIVPEDFCEISFDARKKIVSGETTLEEVSRSIDMS
ncbi:GspE/PulE family protein [Candidatus Cytomitobacter indipagum]|nr:GspE/PulE family protein [Candidatus Cytomitobacter indipagum]